MVMKLPLPGVDVGQFIDTLVQERQNGINAAYFTSIHVEWRTRALAYAVERGDPTILPAWPAIAANKSRFINLYDSPKEHQVQYNILKTLRNRELQLCPGCGEEGTPNTLDHYFPKTDFPEFAVLPDNLAPMCDACQQAKGARLLDAAGDKIYVHPYFDDVGEQQVYSLSILEPFDAPHGFVLEAHAALTPAERALVERHMTGLDLSERYGRYFRNEYIRMLKLARQARESEQIFSGHVTMFRDFHKARGLNVWPHIFYEAVARNDELLQFLDNGDLPDEL